MIQTMLQDLRYGIRMLIKTPGFTAIAIISLALGIGANTALFSVIDALLLKMLPVKEPERLVLFKSVGPKGFSPGNYNGNSSTDPVTGERLMTSFPFQSVQRMRQQPGLLSELVAFGSVGINLSADGRAEVVTGQAVTGNYFTALGVGALMGRVLTDDDDRLGASPAAVISYRYYKQRFNEDPATIGKQVNVNNVAFTIVGVTVPGFEGTGQAGSTQDVSIPIAWEPEIQVERRRSQMSGAGSWWLRIVGRLKPGATANAARVELERTFRESVVEHRSARQTQAAATGGNAISNLDLNQVPKLLLVPGGQGEMNSREYYAPSLYMLLGVVGLVLLIACANVANLLLARSTARQKEISLRLALGASRWRLIRQLLTESVLLAFLGGVVGILFAFWIKNGLLAVNDWGGRGMRALEPRLDWRVLAFTIGLSLLTGIVFGLAPAWRSTKVDLTPALKDSGRGSSAVTRSLLARSLVILQVALSLLLLVGAGLFLRTLVNLQRVDPGFNTRNLLLFGISPSLIGYKEDRLVNLYEQVFERLDNIPGVKQATFSTNTLLSNGSSSRSVYLRDALNATPDAEGRIKSNGIGYVNHVRENFLEVMEIPLIAGRMLQPRDDAKAPRVVVVNQTFANQYFPGESPIGKRFTFDTKKPDDIEIVGLVKDAKYQSQRSDIPATAYIPWRQELGSVAGMTVELRTIGDPYAVVTPVREALRQIESNLPMNNIRTQVEQAEQVLSMERLFAKLLTLFGLLAQTLAAIGLFGVLAYAVSQRTREIGIRMALGAGRQQVLGMVMRQGMTLALIGVAVGLIGTYGLTRLLEDKLNLKKMLFGIQLHDVATYAVIAGILILVTLIACFIPARRATKIDPLVALRYE